MEKDVKNLHFYCEVWVRELKTKKTYKHIDSFLNQRKEINQIKFISDYLVNDKNTYWQWLVILVNLGGK